MMKLWLLAAVATSFVFPFQSAEETRLPAQDNTARAIRIKISQGSEMPLGHHDMYRAQTSRDSHDRRNTERMSTA